MGACLLPLLLVLPGAVPDVVVVCPAEFRAALAPWLEYRAAQGHAIAVLDNAGTAEQIRERIRQASKPGTLRYVVLVGDCEPYGKNDPALRARCVPTHYAKAEVNVLWGSPPHIATDNPFADLDDDQAPDAAVGRLAADSPAELQAIVRKTLDYEQSSDLGPWRRQVNVVAGVGGFGALADMMLESATRYLLLEDIPSSYEITATYASWRSAYCPDPRALHQTTLERLNEGCLFWVYVGHGFHLGLDRMRAPGGEYPILTSQDVAGLQCRHAAPIALFLACYTGAMDAYQDCLAEAMLRTPGAPVAVLAGSRVTMPYAMAVMGGALMNQVFHERRETLGELLLGAKREMLQEAGQENPRRKTLDALATVISPRPDKLAAERAEHVQLFNLFGDPMLRLRHPRAVRLDVASPARPGKPLKVSGESPVRGRASVELVVHRDRLPFDFKGRAQYPQTPGDLAAFQETYRRANDGRLCAVELPVKQGRFHTQLDVPGDAHGPCHLRVFIEAADDYAMGTADVEIENAGNRSPGHELSKTP